MILFGKDTTTRLQADRIEDIFIRLIASKIITPCSPDESFLASRQHQPIKINLPNFLQVVIDIGGVVRRL